MVDLPEFGGAAVDHQEYFFSSWYETVGDDLTMSSVSISITKREAECLVLHRKKARAVHYIKTHPEVELSIDSPEVELWSRQAEDMRLSFSTLCTERYGRVSLEKEEEGVLQSLCDRIQQQIKKFSDHGAFIKLSCRSPKDCGMVLDSFQPVLEEEMNKIMIEAKTYDLEVQSLFPLAFCRSTIRSLRVFSGDEVLSLLLESQRIFDDLLLYLDRVNKGQMKWDMELLIRKWEDIDPAAEVRVYVSSGEIRAIGQYHESYYVPQLVDQTFRKQYEEKIFQIVTHLQPRLSFQNYTIDFAPDQKDSSRIWVIEINPPPPLAGTPMFTFEEQELLQKGPYCFRFLELHPADETTACVPPKFLKWMKEFAKSKNEFQKKGEEEKRDQTVSVHSNQSSGSWCCIL